MIRSALALTVAALWLPATASAGIFGTEPVPISVGPNGEAANGPSGGAAISNDNRKGRLTAFHSLASNLVAGDTNRVSDVFAYTRPRGKRGLGGLDDGPARPAGSLRRVSVSNSGRQANGASYGASVDGYVDESRPTRAPRCVAFISEARNLASSDRDRTPDVFVRNLATRRTYHVSKGLSRAATDPVIDGRCSKVAFVSGGTVRIAPISTGRSSKVGPGRNPDLGVDGRAIAWERAGGIYVKRDGRTVRVASRGKDPSVSSYTTKGWAISFETRDRLSRGDKNTLTDVYQRVVMKTGGPRRTDLISATRRGGRSLDGESENGGVTVYAADRGVVTWATAHGLRTSLYYRNHNTGNIDDLAHANGGTITEISTSARANFVAFSSTATGFRFDRNGAVQDVFLKHLIDGQPL